MAKFFGNIIFALGGLMFTGTCFFIWKMQTDYDFYLWIINRPETSDFGGLQMKIFIYGSGILAGLIFMVVGFYVRKIDGSNLF